MTEQLNLRIAERTIAAINERDVQKYLEQFSERYIGETEVLPEPIRGREGARQYFETLMRAFPDLNFYIEQYIASDDHVVIRALITATHEGSYLGIAPTYKTAGWRACMVLHIVDGEVFRSRTYAENFLLMHQLGVIPGWKAGAIGC
jgi:steroid delta-isomerase-like uncharacterized protein